MGKTYEITLILTTEPEDAHPSTWDWQTLLDTHYPVTVISVFNAKQPGPEWGD